MSHCAIKFMATYGTREHNYVWMFVVYSNNYLQRQLSGEVAVIVFAHVRGSLISHGLIKTYWVHVNSN